MPRINKLFSFHNALPNKDKANVLRLAADYIDTHDEEINHVRLTCGEPFEGVYVINDDEVEEDIKRNSSSL